MSDDLSASRGVVPSDAWLETDRPTVARMYDALLGGARNFPADREAVNRVLADVPGLRADAFANRSFLRRVVRYLIRFHGIRQFLDLGSGIPTVGNVHEIAQQIEPSARVVYTDIDPIAVADARRILAETGQHGTGIVHGDVSDVEAVLGSREADELLDLSKPIALLAVAILHFIPDADDPAGLITAYYDRLASPGSLVAISHYEDTGTDDPTAVQRAAAQYARTPTPGVARDRTQIAALFGGMPLVEPGLVPVDQWRPDEPPTGGARYRCRVLGGVGILGPPA
jgi:hypothetical protein